MKKEKKKAMHKNQQIKSAPISELDDLLKISPLEFVFSEDGKDKFHKDIRPN